MDLRQAVMQISDGKMTSEKWMECYNAVYGALGNYKKPDDEVLETFKALVDTTPERCVTELQRLYYGLRNVKHRIDDRHKMAYHAVEAMSADAALRRYKQVLAWGKAFPSLDHSRVSEVRSIAAEKYIERVKAEVSSTSSISQETRDALATLRVSTIVVADDPVLGSSDLGLPVELMSLVIAKCESVATLAATSKEMRRLCALLRPGSGTMDCKLGASERVLIRIAE